MAKRQRWNPDEKQIKDAMFLTGCGWPISRLAAFFGVKKSTFEVAIKKNKQLAEALVKGREAVSARVTTTAYEMAMSKKHPAMTIFWMKTRERWSAPPRQLEVEHTGLLKDGVEPEEVEKAAQVVSEFKGLLEELTKIPKE